MTDQDPHGHDPHEHGHETPVAPGGRVPPPGYGVPRGIPVHRQPARPPRGGVGVVFAIVAMCGLGLCMVLGLLASVAGSAGGGVGGQLKLSEQTVIEGTTGVTDKVALIEIDGAIARVQAGGLFGGGVDMVERIRKELEAAAEDTNVKALLIAIDSPGGTVTASDQIWHLVTEWKKKTTRPVVIHMGAMCASGGYYIAVAGDELLCEPTTITGSIGVILSGMNFHDLLEKYGVKDITITSGPNKDLLNSTGPVRTDHLKIIQSMIDDAYGRFTDLVAQGRRLPIDEVRTIADGRIYTANQALEKKLVDAIGYREDAFAAAQRRAGSSGATLVRYARQPTLADVFSGAARSPLGGGMLGGELRLDPSLLDQLGAPRLLALWRGAR
jgi:protease-4